jgi:hypothetical protein
MTRLFVKSRPRPTALTWEEQNPTSFIYTSPPRPNGKTEAEPQERAVGQTDRPTEEGPGENR